MYWVDRAFVDNRYQWVTKLWHFGPLQGRTALTLEPIQAYKYVHKMHLLSGVSNDDPSPNSVFAVDLGIHRIVELDISRMRTRYATGSITPPPPQPTIYVWQTENSGSAGAEVTADLNWSVVTNFSWLGTLWIDLVIPIPLPPGERLIANLPSAGSHMYYLLLYGVAEVELL